MSSVFDGGWKRNVSLLEGKSFPVEEGPFPCLRVKRVDVGGGNISLLEGETFPCLGWGKRFPVRGGKVSMMEGETFPCWRGKGFPVGGGNV